MSGGGGGSGSIVIAKRAKSVAQASHSLPDDVMPPFIPVTIYSQQQQQFPYHLYPPLSYTFQTQPWARQDQRTPPPPAPPVWYHPVQEHYARDTESTAPLCTTYYDEYGNPMRYSPTYNPQPRQSQSRRNSGARTAEKPTPPKSLDQSIPQLFNVKSNLSKVLLLSHAQLLRASMECNNYLALSARRETYRYRILDMFLPPSLGDVRVYLSPVRMSSWLGEIITKKLEAGEDCIFPGSLLARYLNQFVALSEDSTSTAIHSMCREMRSCYSSSSSSDVGGGPERESPLPPPIRQDDMGERLNFFLSTDDVKTNMKDTLRKITSAKNERLCKDAFLPTVLLKIVKLENMMVCVRYVAVDTVEEYRKAVQARIKFVREMHAFSKTQFACFWSFPHCMGIAYHSFIQNYEIASFDKVPAQLRDVIDVATTDNEESRRSIILTRIQAFRGLLFGFLPRKDHNTIYHNTCDKLWSLGRANIDQYKVNLRAFGDTCVLIWVELVRDNQDGKSSYVRRARKKLLGMYSIPSEANVGSSSEPLLDVDDSKQFPQLRRKRGQRGGQRNHYASRSESPFGVRKCSSESGEQHA